MHPLALFKYCPKCGSAHFLENNEKSKRCSDCGFVYYFNPSAATVAFILNQKEELLVCRRGKEPAKGTFDLSGGFLDMYETGEQGIAREVLEETGLEVTETNYLFSIPNILCVHIPDKLQRLFLQVRCLLQSFLHTFRMYNLIISHFVYKKLQLEQIAEYKNP